MGKIKIILPKKHEAVEALIRFAHTVTGHGGNKAVEGFLRLRFWIVSARNEVRKELLKCVVCHRWRAQPLKQRMGDLPIERVTPAFPFECSGVDFADPLSIKTSNLRRAAIVKGYLCLFVCSRTKACHIEVVRSLSFFGCIETILCSAWILQNFGIGQCENVFVCQHTAHCGTTKGEKIL